MKQLVIDESKAKKLYPKSSDEMKAILEDTFGKPFFSEKITDRVKTLEDACEALDKDFDDLFDDAADDYEKAEIAIKTFAEALRESKPASECFYYPYLYRSSGGGFSYDDYVGDLVISFVGARLRVDTVEKAQHLGKCMEKYYQTYLSGK